MRRPCFVESSGETRGIFEYHHATASERFLLSLRLMKNAFVAEERTYIWLRPTDRAQSRCQHSFAALGASNTPPITVDHTVEKRAAVPQIDTGHTAQETQQLLNDLPNAMELASYVRDPSCGHIVDQIFPKYSPPSRKLLSVVSLCYHQASRCRPKQMSV